MAPKKAAAGKGDAKKDEVELSKGGKGKADYKELPKEEEAHWPKTDQEEKVESLYADLNKLFVKLEKQRTNKPDKVQALLKDLTNKLKESKALIKDFEREARTDGMPAEILQERRRILVSGLNGFIARKNDLKQLNEERGELMSGARAEEVEDHNKMSTQQLMQKGRKELKETELALDRAERLVEDTVHIGTNTAGTLHDQTKQLEKIVDDLNEIEFDIKKATKVIRDITRGLLTDKCIGFLMFCVVAGIIVLVVLKIVKPNQKKITDAIQNKTNVTGVFSDLINKAKDVAGQGADAISNAGPKHRMARRLMMSLAGVVARHYGLPPDPNDVPLLF